jgi:hypothetical protein
MYQWAGQRLRVLHEVTTVLEFDSTVPAARRVLILEGPTCSGAVLGRRGPCHRACPIMWHPDWIRREN